MNPYKYCQLRRVLQCSYRNKRCDNHLGATECDIYLQWLIENNKKHFEEQRHNGEVLGADAMPRGQPLPPNKYDPKPKQFSGYI